MGEEDNTMEQLSPISFAISKLKPKDLPFSVLSQYFHLSIGQVSGVVGWVWGWYMANFFFLFLSSCFLSNFWI
jgi:hypothetical protein